MKTPFTSPSCVRPQDVPQVAVISPDTPPERLRAIGEFARAFSTHFENWYHWGGGRDRPPSGRLHPLLRPSHRPTIAAGFGIAKAEHVHSLVGVADLAVIGSKLIQLVKPEGEPSGAVFK